MNYIAEYIFASFEQMLNFIDREEPKVQFLCLKKKAHRTCYSPHRIRWSIATLHNRSVYSNSAYPAEPDIRKRKTSADEAALGIGRRVVSQQHLFTLFI